MKSSYLTNLVLIILACTLFWLNSRDDTDTIESVSISTINSDDINHITITRPNNSNISLSKQDSTWQVTQPLQARANSTRIQLLLSLLSTPSEGEMTITDSSMLSQYGLSETSTQLELNEQKFIFGGVESISNKRYILHNKQLHLIHDRIAPLLNANATSFIDNRLLAAKASITKLQLPVYQGNSILADNKSAVMIEKKQGHWTSSQNDKADKLVELVDNWQHAYAIQVLTLAKLPHNNEQRYPVKVWLDDQSQPIEYQLMLSDKAFFIIDQQQQLAYQFVQQHYQQLLLNNTEN